MRRRRRRRRLLESKATQSDTINNELYRSKVDASPAQSVDSEGGHTARPWKEVNKYKNGLRCTFCLQNDESSTTDSPYVSASEGGRDTDPVDSDSDGKDSSPPKKKEKGQKKEQSWWERHWQPVSLI